MLAAASKESIVASLTANDRFKVWQLGLGTRINQRAFPGHSIPPDGPLNQPIHNERIRRTPLRHRNHQGLLDRAFAAALYMT
jgi:hypothetical protein